MGSRPRGPGGEGGETPAPAPGGGNGASAAFDPKFFDNVVAETDKLGAIDKDTVTKGLAEILKLTEALGVTPADSAAKPQDKNIKNAIQLIEQQISNLDDQISKQTTAVLQDSKFKTLEATWRGLYYLVSKTETGPMLKIRVIHAQRDELQSDLENASDFDQSHLFKSIYEAEYGTYGGEPYGLLLSAESFGRSQADVGLLKMLSHVASAAHAPMLAAAQPALLGLSDVHFQNLGDPRDLQTLFGPGTMAEAWNAFRDTEESRYTALTLPRMLMRLPYGADSSPVDGLAFEEAVDGRDATKYLWGSSAFALGHRITNAFALHKWCAAIRGHEGGGRVDDLPLHYFETDKGEIATKCPTETAITDRREKELDELGVAALVHCKNTNYATFFGATSTNKPRTYDSDDANANSRISAQLPYMLAASRFAHYIKSIVRDKIGSFMTREDVDAFLNRWIMQYVLGKDDAGQELKAKYPLREARVDVYDVPGKPGAYRAVVYVRPHFQLDELTASIRLVANLPPPAG